MPKLNHDQVAAAQAQGYQEKTEERKPLPIADGKPYVYKLIGCTAGLSKSTQKPQWTWELTLDGRYHPEFVGTGYLERLWHYTPVDGGNEWAIAKVLHAFGYSPDTDTDELINDEATVLAFLTVDTYGTPPKTTMKVRRLAQHYEEEIPQAKSPMLEEAEEKIAAYAAAQNVPQGPEHPASVANPTGNYQVPADDPWAADAAKAAATEAAATIPPQAQPDENDTF